MQNRLTTGSEVLKKKGTWHIQLSGTKCKSLPIFYLSSSRTRIYPNPEPPNPQTTTKKTRHDVSEAQTGGNRYKSNPLACPYHICPPFSPSFSRSAFCGPFLFAVSLVPGLFLRYRSLPFMAFLPFNFGVSLSFCFLCLFFFFFYLPFLQGPGMRDVREGMERLGDGFGDWRAGVVWSDMICSASSVPRVGGGLIDALSVCLSVCLFLFMSVYLASCLQAMVEDVTSLAFGDRVEKDFESRCVRTGSKKGI